jgi:transcriptional regulator with XRE-family HTH domain
LEEKDDYQSDKQFGAWLKEQRTRVGLTLEDAAAKSCIADSRLKSLEVGYAEKGINKDECEKLASLYKIDLKSFLNRAAES